MSDEIDKMLKILNDLDNKLKKERNIIEDGLPMKANISPTPEEAIKQAEYETYMKSMEISAESEEELREKIDNITDRHIDSMLDDIFWRAMIDILESVRRTVYRWVNTTVALTEDVNYGGTTLKVTSSNRFRVGDEVALHNGADGEPNLIISEIPDKNTIVLAEPVKVITGWRTSANAMLTKTYDGQFVQAIYIGEPDVIPRYPAITILGQRRTSEWFTLGTTKEHYDIQIVVLAENDNHEAAYRNVIRFAEVIQLGLKKNIFPLVGPYETVPIIADVEGGDEFIKVADSSKFTCEDKILLENQYQAEELRVAQIVDPTTIRVWPNPYNPYTVSDRTKAIILSRFIYNSWPSQVEYGFKYKGTLLHAASISWFAEEQEIQRRHGWSDPQLT